MPWVVGAAVVALAALALIVWSMREPRTAVGTAAVAPAAAAAATPPDLGQLTPRERFDRLYNRIMAAAERDDTAEVARFIPMATMAYSQLPAVDADARYHMAMLELQVGNAAAALAQADSITTAAPSHLFPFLIREAEAARRADSAGVRRARQGFAAAYDQEIALERIEYTEHRAALERFRNQ